MSKQQQTKVDKQMRAFVSAMSQCVGTHEGACFEAIPVNVSHELNCPRYVTVQLPTWSHAERFITGDRTTDQGLKTVLEVFIGDWSPVVTDEDRMFRHGLARVLAEAQQPTENSRKVSPDESTNHTRP